MFEDYNGYKLRIYDENGEVLREIPNLYIEEIEVLYKLHKGIDRWTPTVWDQETGDRVMGY